MCNEKFVKQTSNSFQICVEQMKVSKKFKQTSPFESPWSTRRSLITLFRKIIWCLCYVGILQNHLILGEFLFYVSLGRRFRELLLFIKEQRLRSWRTYIFDTGLASGKVRSLIRYDLLNLEKELQSPKKLIFAQARMISMILLCLYYGPDLDSEKSLCRSKRLSLCPRGHIGENGILGACLVVTRDVPNIYNRFQ